MRVFLAVHPGEQLVGDLSARLDSWQGRLPVRWTRPDTWHLTLQFLGEWPETRLEDLQTALAEAATGAPFTMVPGSLDGFPDLRRPRVLFLQMTGDGQGAALAARVREIVDRTWPDGPQDPRPYRGHLTLARLRSPLNRDECNLLKNIDLSGLPEISVEGFSLVVSQRDSQGVRYHDMAFWRLRKKGE